MFCPNCGAQLEDGSTFCTSCGSSLGGGEKKPKQPKSFDLSKINKKMLLIGAGAVAAVVAIVVVIVLLSGSGYGSPEKAAKAYVKAQYSLDVDGMLDCYPDFVIEAMLDKFDVSSRSKLVKELKEELEDEEKQSVKIIDVDVDDKYDKDDIKQLRDRVKRNYDLSSAKAKKITEACKVEVTYEVDGDEETVTFICVKYDGSWYVSG